MSGGGGCLRTSSVQRKFVCLTTVLRIRTWWNQGLFYWYEELFCSDIVEHSMLQNAGNMFQERFSRLQSSLLLSPKPGKKKKKKKNHQTKKQMNEQKSHVIFHAIQSVHHLMG